MANIFKFSYIFFVHQLILPESTQDLNPGNTKDLPVKNASDQLVQVVDHFLNRISGSFVVFVNRGSGDSFLLRTVQSSLKSLYLFDSWSNDLQKYKRFSPFTNINKTVVETKVYPMYSAIVFISSTTELTNLLNDLRGSIWWNHETNLVIISDDFESGCHFARLFLEIVWNFNILSAVYFCFDKESKFFMYTFNPYVHQRTAFWQVSYINQSANNYSWTMFEHSFDESLSLNDITLNLNDLERTKNLNHYNIKMGAVEIKIPLFPGPVREVANYAEMMYVVLDKLNATYTLKFYRDFGAVAESGPIGILKDIETGSISLTSVQYFVRGFWKLHSYPYEFSSLCFATPKKPLNMEYFMGSVVKDWPFIAVVSVLTIGAIKYTYRYSISKTLLEFVRVLTNGAVLQKMTPSGKHFALIAIFTVVCMTSLYLQGIITANKTFPSQGSRIDYLEDLAKSNLDLIGFNSHRDFVHRKDILTKYKNGDETKCLIDISYAGQIKACVSVCKIYSMTFFPLYAHEAKERLTTRPSAFILTADWPLYSKFNLILSYMAEAGLYQRLSITANVQKLTPSEINNYSFESENFQKLKFSFHFLLIGCTLGVCTFLLELIAVRINT